jgi:ribonucleoside-diphosphate reductase alpha chain
MDDIIDLESEKIDLILQKIDGDPESEEIKGTERHLWEKIRKKTLQGRRTGVGITAEGDMLAALGLRYGTESATDFSESVHKTIALNAYKSSVIMAKERGAFEIYDTEREKNNRLSSFERCRSQTLRRYGKIWTSQHCLSHCSTYGHNQSDVANYFGNRTCFSARL